MLSKSKKSVDSLLSDYKSDLLICKHFNLSYLDLTYEITWSEYICMLAVCLDEEELDSRQKAILAGAKPNKIKWSSVDKAGTGSLPKNIKGNDSIVDNVLDFANKWTKGMAMQLTPGVEAQERRAIKASKITGMKLAKLYANNKIVEVESGKVWDTSNYPKKSLIILNRQNEEYS